MRASIGSSVSDGREGWIDVLRGFAVVLMLETHCANVFLNGAASSSGWHGWLNFINGLAAPTFLWIAGYLQGRTVGRAIKHGRPVITPVRLRRLGAVFALGLFLQAPWHAWLAGVFNEAGWRQLCQVNILQCMAASLFLLLVIARLAGSYFRWATFVVLAMVVGCSVLASDWTTGLMPVDAWLNRKDGSIFPLFPWLAFCAAGAVMSAWRPQWKSWIPLAALLMVGGSQVQTGEFNAGHPGFFAERMGWLLGLVAFASLLASRWDLNLVRLFGRESLFVYASHLIILHALPLFAGSTLEQRWGGRLQLPATAVAFGLMLLVCAMLAKLNEQRKKIPFGRSVEADPAPG